MDFLIMDEAAARALATATAAAEARLSPLRVVDGLHAGRYVLPARLAAADHRLTAMERISIEPDQFALEEAFVHVADPQLQELRLRRWVEVKAIRDALENGAAPTPVGPVDCDDRSKTKILGIVQMAVLSLQFQEPFSEDFTLADNQVVSLDGAAAIGMGRATGLFVSRIHARARALRAEIDAAADAEAIAAIDIQSGWPAGA